MLPGNVPIYIAGMTLEAEVVQAIVDAFNNDASLLVTAKLNASGWAKLLNDIAGVHGNALITETVGTMLSGVIGMSGGESGGTTSTPMAVEGEMKEKVGIDATPNANTILYLPNFPGINPLSVGFMLIRRRVDY